jgi:putative membrane protein
VTDDNVGVDPGEHSPRGAGVAAEAHGASALSSSAHSLANGEWHRLHPMTPLLRGGIAVVAILGVIVVNLRDFWVELVLGDVVGDDGGPEGEEFVSGALSSPWLGAILGGAALILVLVIVGFWLSWRMHTFRVTDELVEVRSGILFRTHRRGRLDRIQGINIVRPFLARLVGAAKLDVAVAGQDGNIALAFLGSVQADALRAEILRLASAVRAGEARAAGADAPAAGAAGFINDRVNELIAPELDPSLAAPESIVKIHPIRLAGSLLLSSTTLIGIALVAGIIVFVSMTGELVAVITVVPVVIGLLGVGISRFFKSLRYSIAGTADGVRVGFGLLSTSNETIPPGRIHAVHVHQPLLWRPFGWWSMTISRATTQSMDSSGNRPSTSLLPVGDLDDVRRVLGLVLPGLADEDAAAVLAGITGSGTDAGFTISPPRARIVRWFSRRRNGFALGSGAVLMRTGAIWRQLTVVPLARIQSVALGRGPLARAQRLAGIEVHVVGSVISARIAAIDAQDAAAAFGRIAVGTRDAIAADRSHRWMAEEPAR